MVTGWLVVCQDGDGDAVELASRFRALDLQPVELVLATDLVHGAVWEHRVGGWGCHTHLRLRDGRTIDSDAVAAVLNRLVWVTANGYLGASDVDRDYAGEELQALVHSWLEGFGARVLNRPVGVGLSGPWRTPGEWRAVARAAGLAVRPFPERSELPPDLTAVLVVDGEFVDGGVVGSGVVSGDAPPWVGERVLALVAALDHDLVELRFDAQWRFVDATLMPALAYGGDVRVRAVAAALRARAA